MTDLPELTRDEAIALDRATELLSFLEGFDDAGGHPELLRRARLLANDVVDLTNMVVAERSARFAMRVNRDAVRELLIARGGGQ